MAGRRSYGSGRLFEVSDKAGRVSWYGSWWSGGVRVKRKLGLKRTQGTADGLTRAQAEKELRKRIERDVIVPTAARRTIEQAGGAYVDHLEHVMERKHSTIQDYRGHLRRHLVPFFGERPIDKIDPAHVARYLKRKREEGLSSKTVQNHLNFLHGIFSFAIKRGWAPSNPVALVDRPKKNRSPHQRVRFLQPAELDELIGAVPEDTLGAVERTLYLAAALTGLRQGELLALKWLDIDWQVGRVRVADNFTRGRMDTPKSHEGRSVPMAARLARELEALHQRSRYGGDGDLVFCHPETGTCSPSDAQALHASLARACARSPSTSCATRSARRWPPPGRRCARSRSGWVTPTRRPPRSTAITRPIPHTVRRSSTGHSAAVEGREPT